MTLLPVPMPSSARRRAQFALVLALLLAGSAAPAAAQRRGDFRPSRGDREVRELFDQIARPAAASTLRVLCDGRWRATAVVVAPGRALTKASELHGELQCTREGAAGTPARILAVDDEYDLALLEVEVEGAPSIEWHGAAELRPGRFVVTPDARSTPTGVGVVSSAPGPIPAQSGMLGVLIGDADGGALVETVLADSAAARARMAEQDLITHVDGTAVPSREWLIQNLSARRAGTRVTLTYRRATEELTAVVTLVPRVESDQEDWLTGPLSRVRSGFPTAFRHDTPLHPYHCGGPVLDSKGRAVGLNIARASRTTSYAVPSEQVVGLVARLEERAAGERAQLALR